MNTSIALNHYAVPSFEKELDSIAFYWQKIAAPFTLSISTFVDIKNSFVELIELQNSTYDKLNDFALLLDSMSFSSDVAANSETYSALRHLNDTLEDYYGLLCQDIRREYKESGQNASKWWNIIYFLSSREANKSRKKLMKAVKRHKSKINEILRKADAEIAISSSKFVTLDAETLWKNRCKAYEYIL